LTQADENVMHTWWLLIRNAAGAPMRVTVQADNAYLAFQQARAMYGDKLITENANRC
jgi:hypothetical protein